MKIHRPRLGGVSNHIARYVIAMTSIEAFDLEGDKEKFESAVGNEIKEGLLPSAQKNLALSAAGKGLPVVLKKIASPLLSLVPMSEGKKNISLPYEFFVGGMGRALDAEIAERDTFYNRNTALHFDNFPLQMHLTADGCIHFTLLDIKDALNHEQQGLLSQPVFTLAGRTFPLVRVKGDNVFLTGAFRQDFMQSIDVDVEAARELGIFPADAMRATLPLHEVCSASVTPATRKIRAETGDIVIWNEIRNGSYSRFMHGAVQRGNKSRASESFFLLPARLQCFSPTTLSDVNQRIYDKMKEIELPGEKRGR